MCVWAHCSLSKYLNIVIPISALSFLVVAILVMSFFRFWHATGGTLGQLIDGFANGRAIWDVLLLRYLGGGGHGCNYPDDRFSLIRRWFHQLVLFGFMFCIAATALAAINHHFFHRTAPYPFFSWPVLLGTLGGVALVAGTAGLLCLKWRMDRAPATKRTFGMDVGFLALLFFTGLTGLLLLILRETSFMGTLLIFHLGTVVGLFVTMPYGKFVHAVYRYGALVRNAVEQSRARK